MTLSACPPAHGPRGLQVVSRSTAGNLTKLKMDGFSYRMEPLILEALWSTIVFQVCKILSISVQIGPDMSKLVQTFLNLFKLV